MLRIDETSNTLVAPQQGGFVPDTPPQRSELLHLLAGGWQAFANELGQAHLHYLAREPEPGVDLVAFDAADGRVGVVLVGDAGRELVGRAVIAAAEVAGWDAQDLAEVHEMLSAAVPGDSPRLILVATSWDEQSLAALDWLTRRHGVEVTAHLVSMVRFGSERLMSVVRAYPAADGAAVDPAAQAQRFFADVRANAGGASAPPPGVAPAPQG